MAGRDARKNKNEVSSGIKMSPQPQKKFGYMVFSQDKKHMQDIKIDKITKIMTPNVFNEGRFLLKVQPVASQRTKRWTLEEIRKINGNNE